MGLGLGSRAEDISTPGKAELTARVGLAWGTEALGASDASPRAAGSAAAGSAAAGSAAAVP